jgi:HSP20 family protein
MYKNMKKIFKRLSGLEKKEIEEDEIEENTEDFEMADHMDEEETEEEQWTGNQFEEGQLSIDVFQTPKAIVVKSTIAGVKPDDIDISINNDMLTIRGKREHQEEIKEADYLFRECYWGSFSRSIILPVEVEAEKIEAELENGVLTVTLPKARPTKQISIKVKEK